MKTANTQPQATGAVQTAIHFYTIKALAARYRVSSQTIVRMLRGLPVWVTGGGTGRHVIRRVAASTVETLDNRQIQPSTDNYSKVVR